MSDIRLIKTEADYEAAMAEIDDIFDDLPEPGTPEGDRFELLTVLVSHYEDRHFPIPAADPVDLLRFAITDMGHSQTELASLFGSRSRASEVMNRKRPLTLDMIRGISEAWKLPLEALAAPYEVAKSQPPEKKRVGAR
jgi:HTH-type transcriptional regulator/antitoxin HigA